MLFVGLSWGLLWGERGGEGWDWFSLFWFWGWVWFWSRNFFREMWSDGWEERGLGEEFWEEEEGGAGYWSF